MVELFRILMAGSSRTGVVEDLFKGVCENGVPLIKDCRIPGRNFEAAVSCALPNLLQVHSLVNGPADPRVSGVIGRESLG